MMKKSYKSELDNARSSFLRCFTVSVILFCAISFGMLFQEQIYQTITYLIAPHLHFFDIHGRESIRYLTVKILLYPFNLMFLITIYQGYVFARMRNDTTGKYKYSNGDINSKYS